MTRKRKYKKRYKKRILDYIAIPHLDIDSETKKGIFIIFILALGAISLLGLFNSAGIIGVYLKNLLILAFGWGKWTFPIILIVFGYMLYNENRFDIRLKNYLGIILFILSFHALLFLFVEYDKWDQVLANGGAGGYIGLILANISIKMLGFYASLLLMLSLIIASVLLAMILGLELEEAAKSFVRLLNDAGVKFGILGEEEECDGNEVFMLGEKGLFRVDDLMQDLYFYENPQAVGEFWSPFRAIRGVSEGSMTRFSISLRRFCIL